jgi:hypothetical protein
MQATDVGAEPPRGAKDEVKKIVRGLGGADRMLIAQMDAMVTPLGPMTRRHVGARARARRRRRDRHARRLPARAALRDRRAAGLEPRDRRRVRRRLGEAATRRARAPRRREALVREGRQGEEQRRRHAVLGAPLPARQEPLRGDARAHQHGRGRGRRAQLLGDGQLVDLTKLRLQPGERLPRFYPNLSGRAARSRRRSRSPTARTTTSPPTTTRTRSSPSAAARRCSSSRAATRTSRRRSSSTSTSTSRRHARGYVREVRARAQGAKGRVIFDGVTPRRCRGQRALPRSARARLAGEGGRRAQAAGFDKIDRKHPVVRFTRARRREHRARAQARPRDGRQGRRRVRRGADPRRRHARGLQVRRARLRRARQRSPAAWRGRSSSSTAINWFTDEDASTSRASARARCGASPSGGRSSTQATLKLPDGARREPCRCTRGARCTWASTRASTSSRRRLGGRARRRRRRSPRTCSTPSESAIAPRDTLVVDGKTAGPLEGFHVGVRREIWIYLLIAAALLTALEWATYHRRLTV